MSLEPNPDWIAPRSGHDWIDEDILRTIEWLKSFVTKSEMDRRLEAVERNLIKAHEKWSEAEEFPAFDPKDTIAWYIFQADTYATDRKNWIPTDASLIAPIFNRLGRNLEVLKNIDGIEDRASRMMKAERKQPNGALFELLVANAYKFSGWKHVAFVPEERGIAKTPDLTVSKPRSRWAVECKYMSVSDYAKREVSTAKTLFKSAHDFSLEHYRSIVVQIVFREELSAVPDNYLSDKVAVFFSDPSSNVWSDEISIGRVRDIDWTLCHKIMASDFVYYGHSRMIELLVGRYHHQFDHDMAAKWRPAPNRPGYADTVYQASVVSWQSRSEEAMSRKGRHFKSVIAKAESQLPHDCPGVIHVGMESRNGKAVDARRHLQNMLEASDFQTEGSRLRWVYGNIFAPELTTHQNETWAINETMIPYKIGKHSTNHPLPGHLLLTPDEEGRPGVYWDGD